MVSQQREESFFADCHAVDFISADEYVIQQQDYTRQVAARAARQAREARVMRYLQHAVQHLEARNIRLNSPYQSIALNLAESFDVTQRSSGGEACADALCQCEDCRGIRSITEQLSALSLGGASLKRDPAAQLQFRNRDQSMLEVTPEAPPMLHSSKRWVSDVQSTIAAEARKAQALADARAAQYQRPTGSRFFAVPYKQRDAISMRV